MTIGVLNALLHDPSNIPDRKYDSYNRLPSLESKKANSLFVSSILVVFFANVGLLLQVSQGSRDWSLLMIVGLVSTLLLLVLWAKYRRRKIVCRSCGEGLSEAPRPLSLNYGYLSRGGLILVGTFSALRHKPWRRNNTWFKLTRWTLACHQCKLLEEKHFLKYLPLAADEIEHVQQALRANDETPA